jgi:hypothetical protein
MRREKVLDINQPGMTTANVAMALNPWIPV